MLQSLVEKKKALLQTKKTAANLDEAIDGLQACLRILDVVNRVGEMIKEGKYWSALRVRLLCCMCAAVSVMLTSNAFPLPPTFV